MSGSCKIMKEEKETFATQEMENARVCEKQKSLNKKYVN